MIYLLLACIFLFLLCTYNVFLFFRLKAEIKEHRDSMITLYRFCERLDEELLDVNDSIANTNLQVVDFVNSFTEFAAAITEKSIQDSGDVETFELPETDKGKLN